ncbi:hypothetical protein K438DRAFT_1758689 [Mycena galopus ATCC 62051]|nr:hypothetical protein K438DRAFT_1758689 [Mycena galopus ATCC 62051]
MSFLRFWGRRGARNIDFLEGNHDSPEAHAAGKLVSFPWPSRASAFWWLHHLRAARRAAALMSARRTLPKALGAENPAAASRGASPCHDRAGQRTQANWCRNAEQIDATTRLIHAESCSAPVPTSTVPASLLVASNMLYLRHHPAAIPRVLPCFLWRRGELRGLARPHTGRRTRTPHVAGHLRVVRWAPRAYAKAIAERGEANLYGSDQTMQGPQWMLPNTSKVLLTLVIVILTLQELRSSLFATR